MPLYLCILFGGLPVMCSTLCLNSNLIIKVFSFFTPFVKRFLGLGDFDFNSISPTGTNYSFPDRSLKISMQTYFVTGCKRHPKKFRPIGKKVDLSHV